jgi:hypothetical protein
MIPKLSKSAIIARSSGVDSTVLVAPDGTLVGGFNYGCSSREARRFLARRAKMKNAQPEKEAGRALGTSDTLTTTQITPQRRSELRDTTP